MTARKYILVGLIIAAIVTVSALFFRQHANDKNSGTDPGSDTSIAALSKASDPLPEHQSQNVPHSDDTARKALRAQLFSEYRCPKEKCTSSPFVAETEEEALWMRMRGYPSKQQQEDAKRLSIDELKAKADSGDLVAASLYGQRQIEENDWNGAQATILKTIQRGNIYALYTLAYWEGNHPKHPNPLEARAMIRLAYLAGDYKSTEVLVETFPRFNSPVEQAFIDRSAAHYYRNMLRYRSYPRPPSSE